jgi:hypothetical protein
MWMRLAVPVLAGLDQVVLEGHETVGGKVQCVILTRSGLRSLRAKRTSRGMNDWVQADALPGEVRSWKREPERRGPIAHALVLSEGPSEF